MKSVLGKIHVYTGNGKGKTTAAIGLAVRAAGAGFKVAVIQFLKGQDYSELKVLQRIKGITLQRFGQKTFIHQKGKKPDYRSAQAALIAASQTLGSGKFDVVILDEIIVAAFFKLISEKDILQLIKQKPTKVELILTGRKASKKIMQLADYVTEMKEIKHPYKNGLLARRGIED